MPTGPSSITIIRHGEKPSETDRTVPPFGLDAQGVANVHSLTSVGWQRANALADLVGHDPVRPPFWRPTQLYAPLFSTDESERRTYQTLLPTSARLGLPIQTPFAEDSEPDLATQVAAQASADVLICWEHRRIPRIVATLAQLLGLAALPPNASLWPDDDFWTALIIAPDAAGAGYAITQTSEALLPGDPPAS